MEITLTHSPAPRKDARLVIYNLEGRTGSVQFLKTLFGDNVPQTLTLTGVFAEPKVKGTPEERKARLAALPKPTAAERVAKMEQHLAKLKAKLEAAKAGGDVAPASTASTTQKAEREQDSPKAAVHTPTLPQARRPGRR